jgi:NADPH:quinone reductase-like Zn-dependent oxidoreductase
MRTPEVLEVREIDRPGIGDHDVSVRVHAAGVHRGDWLMPANITLEQAAGFPISAFAALQALRDTGRIQSGHQVLIIGASGGVGTFAVQIAKSFGAEVTGVCSRKNMEMVRSIGADHVIDYAREDFADGER